MVPRGSTPMNLRFVLLAALAAGLSYALTGLFRQYAINRDILDVPNARSSHVVPTPRGGGLAIVTVVLGGIIVLASAGALEARIAFAMLGGALVAVVGWLDDRRSVPPVARALVHAAAAGWLLFWLGGMPSLRLNGEAVRLGVAGDAIAFLAIVWLINLYNFMDGIDGIAGTEAVTVGLAGAVMLIVDAQTDLALVCVLVASAAAGFLRWNWSPARIFMGDSGSGFLGFLFAALAVASERRGGPPAVAWVALLGVFALDATLTLLRRLWRGERWYSAHRSHAYQRLVQVGWSHAHVSAVIVVINVVVAVLVLSSVAAGRGLGLAILASFTMLLFMYLAVERRAPMLKVERQHD